MTRQELIRKVALKMDEISSSDDVIVSVGIDDNNPLYTQIDSLLNESVNEVLMKVPTYRIPQSHTNVISDSTITPLFSNHRKSATIKVPDDFLRLVSITDDEFHRPISELAVEGNDVDKRQHNKFLVAKQSKPVAVIGRDNEDGRVIRCYSYGIDDSAAPSMLYIKMYQDTNPSTDIGLDDYMIDIVTWVCAGKVFAAQGDITKGKTCDENAVALMA